jgi:hypothetical protein
LEKSSVFKVMTPFISEGARRFEKHAASIFVEEEWGKKKLS